MASRDVFSKIIPNVKVTTKFDADGKEIQVEKREDKEINLKQQEIYDILVAAGYFRARIKGLSSFDKIVGGMTWCITACEYDVDVDLLFHENLIIGQKIALTEKIVAVLPKMKCPYRLEPHQIQGLDFINIFPVVQWLVKRSVENRAERAEKLKAFALGQFHNHFSLKSDQDIKEKYINATVNVKQIQDFYGPRRQYKRKDAGPDDEKTRVRITLLEYGNKGRLKSGGIVVGGQQKQQQQMLSNKSQSNENEISVDEDLTTNEIDVDQLLKSLYVANEDDTIVNFELTDTEKMAIRKNYADLKSEMNIDTKLLSEQNQLKALQVVKNGFEKKLSKIQEDNRIVEKRLAEDQRMMERIIDECKEIKMDIRKLDNVDISSDHDKSILRQIRDLVVRNEEMKMEEIKFKEQCKLELAKLHQNITDAEQSTPEDDIRDAQELLEKEKERLKLLRLQLAKKNRGIVSIQRQIDNIPDRTELTQYQYRFIELYNQVNAKHRETKQYFTLYNSLDDTKLYMSKELSILNSIYENYNDGMASVQSREQFLKQFEAIVDGIKQSKSKVKIKCDDEKAKRDGLNSQLLCLVEQQRRYATIVKQFTKECQNNEELTQQLMKLKQQQKTPNNNINNNNSKAIT